MTLNRVSIVLIILAMAAASAFAQEHQSSMDQRGHAVMGFDQQQTQHHFLLFTDGGAIEVGVKNPSDTANRNAIRSHLPHIAVMFAEGNFDAPMLVHNSKEVAGARTMAERKSMIRYQYVETPGGGRVDIVTTDPAALSAVHDFLRFQIAEHRTGDTTAVRTR
jgi:hypothetical protein